MSKPRQSTRALHRGSSVFVVLLLTPMLMAQAPPPPPPGGAPPPTLQIDSPVDFPTEIERFNAGTSIPLTVTATSEFWVSSIEVVGRMPR